MRGSSDSFVSRVPMVAARGREVNYIDLRYSNGFSVGWNVRLHASRSDAEDATPDA